MANTQAARVTGIVLSVDTRSGSKAQPDGSRRDWSMTSARVLVGGRDICDVGIPHGDDGRPMIRTARGEEIDWFVSVRQSGNFLNIDYSSAWESVEADARV